MSIFQRLGYRIIIVVMLLNSIKCSFLKQQEIAFANFITAESLR